MSSLKAFGLVISSCAIWIGNQAFADESFAIRLIEIQDRLKAAQALDVSAGKYQEIHQQLSQLEKNEAKTLQSQPQLQNEIVKTKHLAKLQERLQRCLKNFKNQEGMGRRVLDAAFKLDTSGFNCEGLRRFEDQSFKSLSQAMTADAQKVIYEQMAFQTRMNISVNLVDLNYRLNKKSYKDSQITDQAIKTVCAKGCSEDFKRKLGEVGQKHIDQLRAAGVQGVSLDEAAQSLNGEIRYLNRSSENLIFAENEEDAEFQAQAHYNKYASNYYELSSKGIGLLMNAPSMVEKTGSPRSFDGVEAVKKSKTVYRLDLEKHKDTLSAGDLANGYKEYMGEVKSIISELDDLPKDKKLRADQVQEKFDSFVTSNPLVVAQTLIEHPDYLPLICDSINRVEANEKSAQKATTIRQVALGAAGGLLMVGGFALSGVGVGVPMAIAGAGLITTELGFQAHDYLDAKNHVDSLVEAQMTGGTDQYSVAELQRQRTAMSDAVYDSAMTVGLSATGVGLVAKSAAKVAKATKTMPGAASSMSSFNKVANGSKELFTKMKAKMSESEFAKIFGKIAALPEKTRDVVMKTLTKIANNPNAQANDFINVSNAIDRTLASCT